MISQKDFNKNLDSYIVNIRNKDEDYIDSKKADKQELKPAENFNLEKYDNNERVRSKPSLFSWLFPSSSKLEEEDFDDGVNINIDEEGNVLGENVNDLAEEYQELDKVERKIEKRKNSLFARLFKKREKVARSESDFDEGVELYDKQKETEDVLKLKEDIKKLGIISYEVIRKLDNEELKKFKLSENFYEYKEILKRYNLIRIKF